MGLLTPSRVRRLGAALLLASLVPTAAALAVACFSPSYDEGQFVCGPQMACPPDMECAEDNHCYREPPDFSDGGDPDARIDANLPPDGMLPADGRPPPDAPLADASLVDAPIDAAFDAAPVPDARPPDAAPLPDARPPDAAPLPDARPPDAGPLPDAGVPSIGDEGLYTNVATKTLAPGVVEYQPQHELWSDGAEKRRWIKLPPGTQINSADMDHWRFPTGTKLFKQFSKNGVLLETRVVTRFGQAPGQVDLRAYVWTPDGSNAFFEPGGKQNVNGTSYDVPEQSTCFFCHEGQPHFVLGFQAVQLSRPGPGVTLGSLASAGLLSHPPPPGEDYPVPGNAVQSAALGYLHANCGSCHNPTGYPTRTFGIDMDLFVTVASTLGPVTATPPWATTVAQPLDHFLDPPFTTRVVPQNTAASALFFRASSRGNGAQMPPVATELVDSTGLSKLAAWINSLTP